MTPTRPRPPQPATAADDDGSLGIGSLKGGSSMNHLLRENAPISDGGLELLDSEARSA